MQVVYNSLLNAYANCQLPAKAREVFEKIENEGLHRDVVCTLPVTYPPSHAQIIQLSCLKNAFIVLSSDLIDQS